MVDTSLKPKLQDLVDLAELGRKKDSSEFKNFWWAIRIHSKEAIEKDKLLLTPRELLTLLWRCEKVELELPTNLVGVKLSTKQHKGQLQYLENWEKNKLIPYI